MDISTIDIINVIAIAISPAIAVYIGRQLDDRTERRKDKMEIFKTLMMARIHSWTYESVKALNIIDIVFADDKNVRQAWKDLYSRYCISNPSAIEMKEREQLMYKLIENIGISLGYKDKITWETIQKPYMPEGMKQQLDNQNTYQQLALLILGGMYNTMSQNGTVLNTTKTASNKNTEQKKEHS